MTIQRRSLIDIFDRLQRCYERNGGFAIILSCPYELGGILDQSSSTAHHLTPGIRKEPEVDRLPFL